MKIMDLVTSGHFWRTDLLLILCSFSLLSASASKCRGGRDVFSTVTENSPIGQFIANFAIGADPSDHINLTLGGPGAGWLYLDGKAIRLNSSDTRPLDREVLGVLLLATVKCYEDGSLQSENRIVVEILNENDNKPEFLQSTTRPIEISELTAVNSVAFTVQALDADRDVLVYGIDETSPDANFFRVDWPNVGQITLNRPLNYETKTQLKLHLYAFERDTKERYNTTTTVTINVIDADDQYPQFQPCIVLFLSQSSRICVNPLYTVNVTEKDENIILDFSPGPIRAVDGDRGLKTLLTYTILSGAENGRFVINSESGDVRLTRRLENRLQTPILRLRIMAAQQDDPMKYSVATVLVRVLAENRFPPQFSRSVYNGFVTETRSSASLVTTYGNHLLRLEATDRDFADGFNPKLQYSLSSKSSTSQLYYVTQEGLLICKADLLQPNQKHTLEVLATDQESGDVVKAVIYIEILQPGETVPQGPLDERHVHDSAIAVVAGVCLILLAVAVLVLLCFIKQRSERQNSAKCAEIPVEEHPNVTLQWFQLQVNQRRPLPFVEETYYYEAFGGYDASTSTLHGKQGFYTKIDQDAGRNSHTDLPLDTLTMATTGYAFPDLKFNGRTMDKGASKSVSFQELVVVRD